MSKKPISIIDQHPQSNDVKKYIYSERFGGAGFRLISSGLKDLFDIELSHTSVANWLKKNPPPPEHEPTENQTIKEVLFDDDLYSSLIGKDATEIEKIKAKYYTLIQCDLDKHISNGARLNNDYLRNLKTVIEVLRLENEVKITRYQKNFVWENGQPNDATHKVVVSMERHEPNLKNLTVDELETLEKLLVKIEFEEQHKVIGDEPSEYDEYDNNFDWQHKYSVAEQLKKFRDNRI